MGQRSNLESWKNQSEPGKVLENSLKFVSEKGYEPCLTIEPFTPNVSLDILQTVLYNFPALLTRRICLTIKNFFRVPVNAQVCILYAQKNERDVQFLPMCVLRMQEKSSDQLGDWVWQSLPKNYCNHQGMSFDPPLCHGQEHVYSEGLIQYIQYSKGETWK